MVSNGGFLGFGLCALRRWCGRSWRLGGLWSWGTGVPGLLGAGALPACLDGGVSAGSGGARLRGGDGGLALLKVIRL